MKNMFGSSKITSLFLKFSFAILLWIIFSLVATYVQLQALLKKTLIPIDAKYKIEKQELSLLGPDYSGRWVIKFSQPIAIENLKNLGFSKNNSDDDAYFKKNITESGLVNESLVDWHSYETDCDDCMINIVIQDHSEKAILTYWEN